MSSDVLWLKEQILRARASATGAQVRMEMLRRRFREDGGQLYEEPDEAEHDQQVNTEPVR